MTREEQIKKQADIYTDDASNYTEWNDDEGCYTNDIGLIEKAFIEGAKWADEHPKSHWISVKDDLPCNHKELIDKNFKANFQKTLFVIALSNNNYEDLSCMINENGKWEWIAQGVYTHWMPIPKLPDNENE